METVCDICGKEGARVRHVNRTYGKGDDLLVVRGVPMVTCPNCGESCLTAQTLHEVERIKRERQSVSVRREVAVAEFGQPVCSG